MVEYSLLIGGIGGATFGAVQTYVCGGNLLENVFLGALLGLDFAILAATNPFAASAVGLGFGLSGLRSGFQDMAIHGSTLCNRFTVAMSLLGVAVSAHGLMEFSLPYQQLNIATIEGESIRPVPARGWNRRPLLPISGGSGQPELISLAKRYAQSEATRAKLINSLNSRAREVAVVETSDGTVLYGRSAHGEAPNEALLDILNKHPYNFGCAEVHCLNQALAANMDLQGAKITTVRIQGTLDKPRFSFWNPCPDGCSTLLQILGVKVIPWR
jgi:hypothetical protein